VIERIIAIPGALPPTAVVALVAAAAGLLVIVASVLNNRRHRRALQRVEDRLTHLHGVLSLLTSTTEDGLRSVAMEVGRLAGATDSRSRVLTGPRQRVATAAGQGRSVQDIAATEQLSEGEVLLHLLLDKKRAETSHAEMR
jgi:hypothetical protein